MRVLKEAMSHRVVMLLIRGMGNLPLLVIEAQETSQIVLAIVIDLGLPPKSKTLLLKAPHTSDAGLRTELELTWRPPPWRRALRVSEGAMQVSKAGKQRVAL